MHLRLQKLTVWILTIFLLTLAVLALGIVDNPYFIGFAIIFLPFLLVVQAWYILRDPHSDKPGEEHKNHPEDQWYERH